MASQIDIYNKALGRIGGGEVRVEGENTRQNIECNKAWKGLAEPVLRAHDWNFARHTVMGIPLPGTPLQTRWAYEHKWPIKCVAVRYLYTDDPSCPHKHEIALSTDDPEQVAVFSNVEEPKIVYTRSVERTVMWDASFVDAIAWKLASDIAVPLTQSERRASVSLQAYFATITQARSLNVREGHWDILGRDEDDMLTASRE